MSKTKSIVIVSMCLLTILLSSAGSMKDSDALPWSERPLTWSDFTGTPLAGSPHEAMTSCQVRSGNHYPTMDTVEYTVTCVFIPSTSWVRKKSASDRDLLAHEQVHFDISEYSARVLRQRLRAGTVSITDCNENLICLQDSIGDLNRELQERYDQETEHGIAPISQGVWRTKVDSLLTKMKDFDESVFSVPLDPS